VFCLMSHICGQVDVLHKRGQAERETLARDDVDDEDDDHVFATLSPPSPSPPPPPLTPFIPSFRTFSKSSLPTFDKYATLGPRVGEAKPCSTDDDDDDDATTSDEMPTSLMLKEKEDTMADLSSVINHSRQSLLSTVNKKTVRRSEVDAHDVATMGGGDNSTCSALGTTTTTTTTAARSAVAVGVSDSLSDGLKPREKGDNDQDEGIMEDDEDDDEYGDYIHNNCPLFMKSNKKTCSEEFNQASSVWRNLEGYKVLKTAMTKRQRKEREALKSQVLFLYISHTHKFMLCV
jgi:hypothetical protein